MPDSMEPQVKTVNRVGTVLFVVAMAALWGRLTLGAYDSVQLTQHSAAQPVGPSGMQRVNVNAPGICTGNGTTGSPINCAVTTDGVTLSGSGTTGSPIVFLSVVNAGAYGDGYDGVCAFDGVATPVAGATLAGSTYTQQRDVFCETITVSGGVTLITNQWRTVAKTSITNNGAIRNDGNDGSTFNGGAAKAGNTIGGGGAGAVGNTGAGTAAGAGSTETPRGLSAATGGGNGGAGGAGVSAGGAGGVTGAVFTVGRGDMHDGYLWALSWTGGGVSAAGTFACFPTCSPGGGGGGGNGTVRGGGGGGGAGAMVLAAPIFLGSGTYSANGGNGAVGAAGTGNVGGGGGGKGGLVVVGYSSGSAPTISVAGGTGGAHGGTGGSNGVNGSSGLVLAFPIGAL